MNSSRIAARTYRSLSREAILKIRPAQLPGLTISARPPGSGSGSLGEFIEEINSERSLKLPIELSQEENHDLCRQY